MDLGIWKTYVLGFVVMAIVIGISGSIMSQVRQQQCNTSVAGGGYNAVTGDCFANSTTIASNTSTSGLVGIDTFADWLPTIAVILSAAVVIGIIVHYFV